MGYRDVLNKKAKEWGCIDMLNSVKDDIPKIPFSSPLLNWLTYGGVPRGRITEFFGEESGGKSTSAIDLCFNAKKVFLKEHEDTIQRYRDLIAQGKKEYAGPLEDLIDQGPKGVLYFDLEHTFDWKWAGKLGLHKGDIDVGQPGDVPAEQICQAIQDSIVEGDLGLIIIDSIPSLVTAAELEKKYGERTVSSLAGLMTIFMRKLPPLCSKYDCTVVLINQTRDNMDNPYVLQTPGGRAIKFFCSTRLYFKKGSPLDFAGNDIPQNVDNPAGYKIAVKLVKQKAGACDRKVGSYFLMAQTGIRPDFDYAKLAVDKYNLIIKKGAWFSICDPSTGEILEEDGKPVKVNGMLRIYDYLASHPDYYQKLKTFINNDINGIQSDMSDIVPSDINCPIDSETGETEVP